MLFRMLSPERELALDSFCSDCSEREYTKFDSLDHAYTHIEFPKLIYKDWESLKHFSSFGYFDLNRAVKGTWNYEDNGSANRMETYKKYADDVCSAIKNNQTSIGNVRVYRGVPIKHFKEYGINSVDELVAKEGQYLLNSGFTSTSLVEDKCFYMVCKLSHSLNTQRLLMV